MQHTKQSASCVLVSARRVDDPNRAKDLVAHVLQDLIRDIPQDVFDNLGLTLGDVQEGRMLRGGEWRDLLGSRVFMCWEKFHVLGEEAAETFSCGEWVT